MCLVHIRRSSVELARERAKPVAEIAKDVEISESRVRRWMDVADVDAGHRGGVTSAERAELSSCAASFGRADSEQIGDGCR